MTYFSFSGALALSYCAHWLLRRYVVGEYHPADGDDACESPATFTEAGQGVLPDNDIGPSTASLPASEEDIRDFLRSYEIPVRRQGFVSRKKSGLYLKALNTARPPNFPKLLRVPTVEVLPIIFECPDEELVSEADALLSQAEEVDSQETASSPEPDEKKKKKKFSKIRGFFKRLSCIRKMKD